MSRRREQIAAEFHTRVRENCWDTLAGRLLRLHEPHVVDGTPVCRGCDRERSDQSGGDPVWPCRTYTIIASAMLTAQDVEATLERLEGDRGGLSGGHFLQAIPAVTVSPTSSS